MPRVSDAAPEVQRMAPDAGHFGGGGVMGLYLSAGDLNCAWLVVEPMHGMGSSPGLLYATADGGARWTLVAGHEVAGVSDTLPYGGAIRFTSSTTGWISGVTANTLPASLSVTRDGGRTWQPVELPLPPGYSQGHLSIGLPGFFGAGQEEGFVAAEFWPESHQTSEFATILYITQDGGHSWDPVDARMGEPTPVTTCPDSGLAHSFAAG